MCLCAPGHGREGDRCVRCGRGEVPGDDGRCALCPADHVAGLGNEKCIAPSACEAVAGAEVDKNQCVCKAGTALQDGACAPTCHGFLGLAGECLERCPPGAVVVHGNQCACPDDRKPENGACVCLRFAGLDGSCVDQCPPGAASDE